ncbi:hypothetical protein DY000_02030603 [Brassica cretica]|uniref:Solute-binding protein family 3/N-terminal domain-containing protein n=1 Tax=Brassica cretica TaxID=69181 RepID=A0ABQ7DP32_BRACR|nr:hypothetical protein DY000_02030603 [Brassica cretica]
MSVRIPMFSCSGCTEVVSSGAGRLQARREGQHIIKQNFCSGEADSGRLLSRVQTGEIDFAIVSSHYFTLSSSTVVDDENEKDIAKVTLSSNTLHQGITRELPINDKYVKAIEESALLEGSSTSKQTIQGIP